MSVECHEIVFDLNVKRNCFHKNHNSECTNPYFGVTQTRRGSVSVPLVYIITNSNNIEFLDTLYCLRKVTKHCNKVTFV